MADEKLRDLRDEYRRTMRSLGAHLRLLRFSRDPATPPTPPDHPDWHGEYKRLRADSDAARAAFEAAIEAR